jgi:hypothetical protein
VQVVGRTFCWRRIGASGTIQHSLAPYLTIDDVVDGFADLEQRFRSRGDRRAIFVTLYAVVSQEMQSRIRLGAFLDPAWVHQYTVAFANLYKDALEAYDAGNMAAVPRAWRSVSTQREPETASCCRTCSWGSMPT